MSITITFIFIVFVFDRLHPKKYQLSSLKNNIHNENITISEAKSHSFTQC